MSIDQTLFFFLNQTIANPVLDVLMRLLTTLGRAPLIFIPFWIWLFFKGGRAGKLTCWGLLAVLLISDMVPAHVLKPFFGRLRPFLELEGVRLLDAHPERLSQFSFPSNHASNIAAVGSFLMMRYKEKWVWGVSLSLIFLIGLSRIYMGVHYPSDVLGGFAFGVFSAFIVNVILKKLNRLKK